MSTKYESQEAFDHVKKEIENSINEIQRVMPDLATYLRANIIFDAERHTVTYIGDKNISMKLG
jgi:uncharacterized protein YwgA